MLSNEIWAEEYCKNLQHYRVFIIYKFVICRFYNIFAEWNLQSLPFKCQRTLLDPRIEMSFSLWLLPDICWVLYLLQGM